MSNNGYFNIKRDKELIAADTHFWCETCLVARPLAEQSPDPRYCKSCYVFLLKEAELLTGHSKKASWIPKPQKEATQKVAPISQYGGGIMSTVKGKKIEVDKIQPSVAIETHARRLSNKRGRKPKELPEDLIVELAGKGMGSKAIASNLRADHNITISYKTIQRILARKAII